MSLPQNESIEPVTPTEEDSVLAAVSGRRLAQLVDHAIEFRVESRNGRAGEAVVVPRSAVRLLVEALAQMAQGNAVTLIPIHAEMTTQQAADLLNVSRPFLIKMLEKGTIPFRSVGKHRRIRYSDVLEFKRSSDRDRAAALLRLTKEGQDLRMGY